MDGSIVIHVQYVAGLDINLGLVLLSVSLCCSNSVPRSLKSGEYLTSIVVYIVVPTKRPLTTQKDTVANKDIYHICSFSLVRGLSADEDFQAEMFCFNISVSCYMTMLEIISPINTSVSLCIAMKLKDSVALHFINFLVHVKGCCNPVDTSPV